MVATVRPTTLARHRAWGRATAVVAAGVALALVVALVVAVVADRRGDHPGARSGVRSPALGAWVAPPPNADVDGFETAGALGRVGDLPWRVEQGRFAADGSFARGTPTAGRAVALVDPGADTAMAQVDLFRPVAGSGLVFRWEGPDDHWAATVAPGGERWQLTRTVDGVLQVLGSAPGPVQGGTVGFRADADTVELMANGILWATVDDVPAPAGATAMGLLATDPEVRFDQFAVFVG